MNEKSKECCKKCKDEELTGYDICAFSHCECHKPSVEVSKCCGARNTFGMCFACGKPFEPQSIPLDRDEREEKRKPCGCIEGVGGGQNCNKCYPKTDSTSNLTPESTEMEEWKKELVSILPLQHATLEVHNILFKFINKTLDSHSQKLVSEIKEKMLKNKNYVAQHLEEYCNGYNQAIEDSKNIINNIK